MNFSELRRREFLGSLATLSAAAALHGEARDGVIYRNLGSTGERVSAIGLGGYHIGVPSQEEGIRIIRTALDRGINFLDNSCDYHGGRSEIWMGMALRDGYRKRAFLMTKYNGRTRASAAEQIDESLKRLQTDHIDLIQFHENIRMTDADKYFAPGGAHEAVMAAKKAGKVRYVGFTGHKDPSIHLHMLDLAAKNGFHFDSCQMPLNVLDYHFRSFAHQVVPRLVKEKTAVLGMKPLASGLMFRLKDVDAIECLHYALSLPTSVVMNGCDSVERLDQAFRAMKTFKPMNEAQIEALTAKTREAALSGSIERFKTSEDFDGTTHDPASMG
ncbi:MAG TPA: aldo/keto reductase [Bryobacteraceae bacterium]|jgi:aryl-alcohol dehydrogenase-like predicted oxidoreductase|nr:aldo/keto reductase [Bryobacteraceae bacterium]